MKATDVAWIAGRVLLGGFFLYAAFNHFINGADIAEAAASNNVPLPTVAAYGTGILLLLGAVSILSGAIPRVGLAALVIFFVGVTPVMHDFWNVAGAERSLQMAFFLRNVALTGAALTLMGVPVPWTYGIGEMARVRAGETGGARRT